MEDPNLKYHNATIYGWFTMEHPNLKWIYKWGYPHVPPCTFLRKAPMTKNFHPDVIVFPSLWVQMNWFGWTNYTVSGMAPICFFAQDQPDDGCHGSKNDGFEVDFPKSLRV